MTMAMARRLDFGQHGGPVALFDFYESWRDDRVRVIEAGVNPRTNEPFDTRILEALGAGNTRILEASPDSRADFATFLDMWISPTFYDGYTYVESQWNKFLGTVSLNTFDEVRITGINGLTGIGKVGDLGEYPGMRRTVRPEAAIVLETYGGEYKMTRKLLRSKGVDVLTRDLPTAMGQAFADFVTRLFIAMVVANPNGPDGVAMYHSSRGNTTTAALSEDSVVDAAVWLETRVDPDSRPIATKIRSVVVQNSRQALRLRQIVNSQLTGIVNNDIATTAMGRGTMNPIADAGIIPADGIIVDPWMPDANDIYYFGDPNKRPAFTAAFLDGQKRPALLMADTTMMHLQNSSGSGMDPYNAVDEVHYKGRHDVGIAAIEPLSTYRQTPA